VTSGLLKSLFPGEAFNREELEDELRGCTAERSWQSESHEERIERQF